MFLMCHWPRKLTVIAAVLSFATLTACVTEQGYPGKALPDEELAVIEIEDGLSHSIVIHKIDEYRLPNAFARGAEVPAGCHRIVAGLGRAGFSPAGFFGGSWVAPTYAGCTEFVACVEAGGTYTLAKGGHYSVRLRDLRTGRNVGSGGLRAHGFEGCPYAMNSYESPLSVKKVSDDTADGRKDGPSAVATSDDRRPQAARVIGTSSDLPDAYTQWDGRWLGEGVRWRIELTIDRGRVSGVARNNTACRPCAVTGKIDRHGLVNAQIPSREQESSAVLKGQMPTLKIERRWMPTSQHKIALEQVVN